MLLFDHVNAFLYVTAFYRNEGILTKLKRNIKAENILQSGRIDIIRSDGSRETVKSSNQNCLFHALIQATTNNPNSVVLEKAKELRRKVGEEVTKNMLSKFSDLA